MAKIDTIKVEVTEQDIHDGVKASCSNCPNALAISRVLGPDFTQVTVGAINTLAINSNGSCAFSSRLPFGVMKWIADFDSGRKVKPITYTLTNELG